MIGFLIVGGLIFFTNNKGQNVAVPQDKFFRFDVWFKKYASQFGLDWKILKAICMNESSLGMHPRVARGLLYPTDIEGSKSEDGLSWGIMQFKVSTARDYDSSATEVKLNNPEYSIKLAAQHVAWLSLRFDNSDGRKTEWMIKSYNQGVGNTGKERRNEFKGVAQEYFERFVRNFKTLQGAS